MLLVGVPSTFGGRPISFVGEKCIFGGIKHSLYELLCTCGKREKTLLLESRT